MAQRISRAKQAIRESGAGFELPGPAERPARLGIVLHVLYLIFNEGYTATGGADLTAPELSGEAIRLTRWLHRLLPQDQEIAGLLALMLLTDARRDARTGPDGSLIPLGEQDRSRWDAGRVAEGVALISAVLPDGQVGPVPGTGGDRRRARRGANPWTPPTGRRSSGSTSCSSTWPRARWSASTGRSRSRW